uniref:Uncharacterized protein n=1 Tax=Heterorhabditis bacteriophora TaxID=37862 RepID=A0A1I7X389_HETBA
MKASDIDSGKRHLATRLYSPLNRWRLANLKKKRSPAADAQRWNKCLLAIKDVASIDHARTCNARTRKEGSKLCFKKTNSINKRLRTRNNGIVKVSKR